MKILHTEGYTQKELIGFNKVLVSNTLIGIQKLIHEVDRYGLFLQNDNQERAKQISGLNENDVKELDEISVENIEKLWQDPSIQTTWQRRNEYQLPDSTDYCMSNIRTFSVPDYVPTKDDVLRVRIRTTGISEITFALNSCPFRMMDVGGQRSERKKWIYCFEDVTAIIYCFSLNEYDMSLYEDEKVNRMVESLELFEEICNSKWFTKTAIIIFMNKSDLFKEKISKVDLNVLFEDYKGGRNYDNGIEFLEEKFHSLNRQQGKKLFVHVTTATDTENIKVVFNAAKEIIVSQSLATIGFGDL